MPTNKSIRGTAASASKSKKKTLPPQPAMFRLHNPVEAATVPSSIVVEAEVEKKTMVKKTMVETTMVETEGGAKPGVASTDGPSVMPPIESDKKEFADDVASMDQTLAAKEMVDKQESDKDSIAGEINKKSPSPEPKRHPDKSSHDCLPKNIAQNKIDSYFLDSDSDNDDKPQFPKSAIKRPRNSVSAVAYAKRMREKEEASKKESGKEELLGVSGGDEDINKKDKGKAKGKGDNGNKSATKDGEKEASTTKKGHVKTKHTPKVPDDLPPRKSTSRKKSAAAKAASLKSPPEEMQPTRPRSKRLSASSAGLKSPPEEVEEVPPKKKSSSKKSLPASKEESPPKRRASKTPAKASAKSPAVSSERRSKREKRSASKVAQELVSTLEEAETIEEETTPRRSKRARKPSLAAAAAAHNNAVSLALAATSSTKPAAKPSPSKRKAPTAREAPSPKKQKSAAEYLEAKKTDTWIKRVAMLKAHRELYDTCDLTFAPKDSVPPLLQSFVGESRKQYKKYQRREHSSLTAARIDELEKLGFDFAPLTTGKTRGNHDRRFQRQWDEQFEAVKKYKAIHGDCLVSCTGPGEYAKLGNWVRGQRKLLNRVGLEGFNPERMAKLVEIGFDFDPMRSGAFHAKKRASMFPRIDANWERHYLDYLSYKKKEGNITIGPNTEGYPGLYDWIHCQRKEYKKWEAKDPKSLMCEKWIKKLNDLGFDWAPMKSEGFSKMLLQRQSKHFHVLWMQHYADLKAFRKKHGHCYASRLGDEQVLASWVHVQRKNKKKHDEGIVTPLSAERIKLLNDLNLDWAPAKSGGMLAVTQVRRDEDWEGIFDKLVSFKNKSGHANPKKVEPTIGPWACRMRKLYSQKQNGVTTTLSDVKIAKLESIGFRFGRLRDLED